MAAKFAIPHWCHHLFTLCPTAEYSVTFPFQDSSLRADNFEMLPSVVVNYPDEPFQVHLMRSVGTWVLFQFRVSTLKRHSGSDRKASACSGGDPGSIPGLGRSPGEGNGNQLQYS